MANNKIKVSFKLEDFPMVIEEMEKLLQENKQLKEENKDLKRTCELFSNSLWSGDLKRAEERIDKAIKYIDITIEIIKQQPTEDDSWILDKLNGFKIILKGEENE